ncbi:MAG: hypothetical protein VB142_06530 [Burkholderia sp.]
MVALERSSMCQTRDILLRGAEEYKNMMSDIAADKVLYVEFNDKGLQERYEQRLEAIKAGGPGLHGPGRAVPSPPRAAEGAAPSRNRNAASNSRSAGRATLAAACSALPFWRHRGDLAMAAASPFSTHAIHSKYDLLK